MKPVTAIESRPDPGNQKQNSTLIGAVQQTGTDNAFAATPKTVRPSSGEHTADLKISRSRESIHGSEEFMNPTNTQEERGERRGHGPIRTESEHGSLEQSGSQEAITGSIDENKLVNPSLSSENASENGEIRLSPNRALTRTARNAQVDIWLQETFDAGQNIAFQEYIAEEAGFADVCSSSSDEDEPTLCEVQTSREPPREYEITEERAQIMDDLEDLIGRQGREEPQQIQEPIVDEIIFQSDEPIKFDGVGRFFRKLTASRLKRKVVEWSRKVRGAAKSSGGMFQPNVHVETALRRTFSASIQALIPEADERFHVSPREAADLRIRVLRENFIHHMEELRETRRLANATQSAQRFDVLEFSYEVRVSSVAEPAASVQAAEPEIVIQASEPEISVQAVESEISVNVAVNAAGPTTSMEATESEPSIQEIEPEFKQNYVTWIEGFNGFCRTTRKRRTRRRRSSRNDTSVPQRVHFESLPESRLQLINGSSHSDILEEVSSRLTFPVNDEVPVVESSSAAGINYGQQIINSLGEDSHVEEGSIDSEDYNT